ncbi:MAG: transposase [Thermogutta sp.]
MRFDPERHHRRSIRLRGYDYTQPGAYFVTVCTQGRASLFGEVADGEMRLNEVGRIVQRCWEAIPEHFPHIELGAFVVMPNHVHGILVITGAPHDLVGSRHAVPLQNDVPPPNNALISNNAVPLQERLGKPVAGSIPTIVRSFKSAVTREVNALRGTPGAPVWQRNYYEHIIWNEESLQRIREYIWTNPLGWHLDRENPNPTGMDDFDRWLAALGKIGAQRGRMDNEQT